MGVPCLPAFFARCSPVAGASYHHLVQACLPVPPNQPTALFVWAARAPAGKRARAPLISLHAVIYLQHSGQHIEFGLQSGVVWQSACRRTQAYTVGISSQPRLHRLPWCTVSASFMWCTAAITRKGHQLSQSPRAESELCRSTVMFSLIVAMRALSPWHRSQLSVVSVFPTIRKRGAGDNPKLVVEAARKRHGAETNTRHCSAARLLTHGK